MTASVLTVAFSEQRTSELEALVLRARGGDTEAYGDLVERTWSDLVALARGMLGGDAEAEDLVQEALVHAWKRLWMLRQPEKVEAWLRRIVARRCLSWARRRRPQELPPETAGSASDPAAGLDAARLLQTLAPRQRAVLYLTWIEGCTDKEAGGILGIRPATIRVHRFRGMQILRRLVREQ
ncbi:MAG: sigma-70 family RNA polymerase sigma factor [Acidobacteriota bacterium]|nr:sigma-70 family RNA polymerase sigma factor [Acidobacteriota bacterium]